MAERDEDDHIPTLDDMVRAGRETAARRPAEGGTGALTEAEIEAIAARVVERHLKEMERAVARAIRAALEHRTREDPGGGGVRPSGDGEP